MRNFFYSRLAWDSLRKNMQIYIPYLLTCIGCTAMFYIMSALSVNSSLQEIKGSRTMTSILSFGVQVIAVFSVIFLFYTNSFLIKRRKKELGLYSVLGMEKKHLFRLMLWETVYLAGFSTVLGLAAGLLLNKAAFLLVLKIMRFDVVFGFEISVDSMVKTVILFAVIYLLTLLNNIRSIAMSNPIELVRGGSVGEREPKTRWVMAILGVVLIGVGYYISITTMNPLDAFGKFFFAVIAVILGTYFLFMAASIALLKLLRKNKRYYYKTNHFISVSGMIYRMKQNAVGLASICVLCTMVLVTVSSTLSLYLGFDDLIHTTFPYQFRFTWCEEENDFAPEEFAGYVHETAAQENVHIIREKTYTLACCMTKRTDDSFTSTFNYDDPQYCTVYLLSAEEFPELSNKAEGMDENEVIVYPLDGMKYPYDSMNLFGKTYQLKDRLESFEELPVSSYAGTDTVCIFVKNRETVANLLEREGKGSELLWYYDADTDGTEEQQQKLYDKLFYNSDLNFAGGMDCRAENENYLFSTYGGLFFIGIFLGLMFLMGAVLIVYYKQISEGYDDRQRFDIMQRVGLTKREIKRSIRSQVLTVFFLPLVTACVHMTAAFPIVSRILKLLRLTNTQLFVFGLLGTVAVFSAVYIIVYAITSRTYYKIVSE